VNDRSLLFRDARWQNAGIMHRPLPRRLLVLGWLLGWLTTPVVSLALLVHVTSHHHHDHHRALDLAFAATHGHSHTVASAEHEHIAVRESAPPAVAAMLAGPHQATVADAVSRTGGVALSDRPPPTGSPPLFYQHCSLLL
jgi:hypothetical protein